jgi:hypothetical protein
VQSFGRVYRAAFTERGCEVSRLTHPSTVIAADWRVGERTATAIVIAKKERMLHVHRPSRADEDAAVRGVAFVGRAEGR